MPISRRTFTTAATAALASAAATSRGLISQVAALPTTASTRLRLGLVTYNWGKDWELPTILSNCQATGFEGVELRSTHRHGVEPNLSESRRKEVRKRFADSPVTLAGLGSACEYHAVDQAVLRRNIEQTKAFVRLCHDIGGGGVKVRPNGLPKERPVEQTLEQIGKSLLQVGRFAADYGVQIRVEVHGRGTSEIPHMKTIFDICDHPSVAVCWNCNPTDLHGAGLEANYRLLQDRMGTIHIHDLRSDAYPWDRLFPLLKQTRCSSFTGWTLLEEGSVPADVVSAMHQNRRLWEQLVG